jgi:LysM repeat protein
LPGYDRRNVRMSFLVSALLALAVVATIAGLVVYMGLLPQGGGVATASSTPRGSFAVPSIAISPSPSVAPSPSASASPSAPAFSPGGPYSVQPGDSLSLIGDKVGVSWLLIAEANNIAGPDYVVQVGQILVIPAVAEVTPGGNIYVVQPGDSITKIATKLQLDPTTLADFNNIADWNTIQVGQVLYIPSDSNATPLPTVSPS